MVERAGTWHFDRRRVLPRLVAIATLIASLTPPAVRADTAPTLVSVSPNTVSEGADGVVLVVTGDGIGTSSVLRWRSIDHPIVFVGGIGDDSAPLGAVIPASELAISEAFETVSVTVSTGGASSNPRPVTILGEGVVRAQSAIVGAGGSATVAAQGLIATYHRTGAGFGTITVADYLAPSGPPIIPGSPPIVPGGPPISPVAYVDLQVLGSAAGDRVVGTFVPPNPVYPVDPIVPPNPVYPTDPVVPPNPVRLAYWAGSSWQPVVGSGGVIPTFTFDRATLTASSATVTFDETSAPAIEALGGTPFAVVAASAFVGFDTPVDPHATNVARAGRAIPLKWWVLDLAGRPVVGIGTDRVRLSSVRVGCATLGQDEDPVEAYATGSSGLREVGNGAYAWNWSTEKSWSGTCRRLLLDLGDRNPDGTPIYRTADFQFVR